MVKNFVLKQGDIVYADFGKTVGHEQSGVRPALVISHSHFNNKSGLCMLCPITSKIKNYPFEVLIRNRDIHGVVLSDQVRTLDFKNRKVKKYSTAPKKVLDEVKEKIKILIS